MTSIDQRPVLIVAPTEDVHAQAVAAVLDRDFAVPTVIWDRATLPRNAAIDFRVGVAGSATLLHTDAGDFPLDEFRSVWWRRALGFEIDPAVSDPRVRRYCATECDAFVKGVTRSLAIPFVNDPFAEIVASRKPFQLATAARLGISIPETLVTNNPAAVTDFWQAHHGDCIYKPLNAPDWTLPETRVLTQDDLAHLEKLRHAPMIVQEKIEKGVDVRVNIFGSQVFACEVDSAVPEAQLDWRLDLTAQWRAHDLPTALGDRLVDLLRVLGLHYGCIDLRRQPDGQYRFFEVNPSGQFLFAEIDTGQPLLNALAALLVNAQATAFECHHHTESSVRV